MLTSLSPHRLWQIFSEICAIPHPSHHEEKIIEYILCFAKKYNIFAEQDKVGNILLRKKASDGMENCPSIVLQAHLDMVPQKMKKPIMIFCSILFSLILTVNGSKQKIQRLERIMVSVCHQHYLY